MSAIYIPIKKIVAMALDENRKTVKDFDRYWIFAFRALKKLNQSIAAEPKTVRLPKLGNDTVVLPSDYISWTKIGVINSAGEVVPLTINNKLSAFRDNNPNRIASLTPDVTTNNISDYPVFYNYYYNGSCFDLSYIQGGMISYGECRVDEKNNVIVLPKDFQYDSIIIEYISNPQQDNDYVIQECLQEAVISFIKWKDKLGSDQEFYAAAIDGRRGLEKKRVTVQRINQAVTQHFTRSGYNGGFGGNFNTVF